MGCGCNEENSTNPQTRLLSEPIPPSHTAGVIDSNSPEQIVVLNVQHQTNMRFSVRRVEETVIGNLVVGLFARLGSCDPNWTEMSIEDRITGEGMSVYPIDVSGIYEVAAKVVTESGTADTRARLTLYAE